eukprot:TRINITY_DN20585_c0_g3_i2.p1 TRINITY_DN20585_c0_g3~~TRINITY_DN20585_c0_g3_i2.p1  ORF type:complete len:242 (+),score=48.76 TRINITY_DN20585_c0_g3_i2:67-726(+)
MTAKKGHIVAGFFSMVCAVFSGIVLGDGRSLVIIEANSTGTLRSYPDGYGIGVFKDSRGNDWMDKGHPLDVMECDKHQRRGNAAKAFTIIAIIASSAAVLVSLLGASEGGIFGTVNIAIQCLMFISFTLATAMAWNVMEGNFYCDAINAHYKLTDDFIYNYGVFFLLSGIFFSLASIGILIATGSLSKEEETPPAPEVHEPTADPELEKKEEPATDNQP